MQILLATAFCQEAHRRVRANIQAIEDAPLASGDVYMQQISAKVVENKGYMCEHPLARTFW